MNRRGLAVIEIIIVAVVIMAFGWFFASSGENTAETQNVGVVAVDNGAGDNTLREGR